MKNYVIFKNINSNTFPGLIISELPPITKPKMKLETSSIDGVDGDSYEILGYSSYDKNIEIGLTKNYDIDKISSFFNGEGQVIFSNEPDKYYKAHCYYSIDYERLVKFRKAKVKFHVQPFKYKLNEEDVTLDILDQEFLNVENFGSIDSKPIIQLFGDGIIHISINDTEIFSIDIDDEFVVINSELQDAYKNEILKNRQMIGSFPILKPGINKISWTGDLKKIIISPKSRWI